MDSSFSGVFKLNGYLIKIMSQKRDQHIGFKSLRHGNYGELINRMKTSKNVIVAYNNGVIKREDEITQENDGDIVTLLTAFNAIQKLGDVVFKQHGNIPDKTISAKIYDKLGEYELGLRIIYNKTNSYVDGIELNQIIKSFNISDSDKIKLENGRKFLNAVKHNDLKNKFNTWKDGIEKFNEAFETYRNLYYSE